LMVEDRVALVNKWSWSGPFAPEQAGKKIVGKQSDNPLTASLPLTRTRSSSGVLVFAKRDLGKVVP